MSVPPRTRLPSPLRRILLLSAVAVGATFAPSEAVAGNSTNLGDVAVTVNDGGVCGVYKLSAVDGSIIWGPQTTVTGHNCAVAVDQADLSVYVGMGVGGSGGSGTLSKFSSNGTSAGWSSGNIPGAGCDAPYAVYGMSVDTTSASPGVVMISGGCFGYMEKNSRVTGSSLWVDGTDDFGGNSAINPSNGQIYAVTGWGGSYDQLYSVATGGGVNTYGWSPDSGAGPELNPTDGSLYYASGTTLYQLSTASPGSSNWSVGMSALTCIGNIGVQPWLGGMIYAVDTCGGKVAVVNPITRAVVRSFTPATPPAVSAFDPLGGNIYLANSVSNTVQALDRYGNILWTSPSLAGNVMNIAAPRNTLGAPPLPPGCGMGYNVALSTTMGDYQSIQAALDALPKTLTANTCIVVRDTQTYIANSTVTVANFVNNGFSLTIEDDPSFVSSAPTLSPILTGGNAAVFSITNASVTIRGINISPSTNFKYGLFVSSANVVISSVNVQDAVGEITTAGIVLSSWTTVSYTSVTVGGSVTNGFWLPGSTATTVSYSTAVVTFLNNANDALWLNGASSNTFTVFTASNPYGYGVYADANSAYNTIQQSTMTSSSGANQPLYLSGAFSNTIKQSYMFNSAWGYAAQLANGAFSNTISLSTMTTAGIGGSGLYMNGASSNTITTSVANGPWFGVYLLNSSNYNTISYSTASTTNYGGVIFTNYSDSNTFTQSYIFSSGSRGAVFQTGAAGNTISWSTVTAVTGPYGVLLLASSDTISNSFVTAPAGEAVFEQYANGNTISYSTVTNGNSSYYAVNMQGASSNTITQSYIENTSLGGSAVDIDAGSSDNAISWSTVTGSGLAVYLNSSSNTISNSFMSAPGSYAAYFNPGSNYNTIIQSTMTTNNNGGSDGALYMNGAASNTIASCYIGNPLGNAVYLLASLNTISQTTMTTNSGFSAIFFNVGSASNVISGSFISNPSGYGAHLNTNANWNTISQTTMTSSVNGGGGFAISALSLFEASSNMITGDYIQGSTAAEVTGSTGTVIIDSVLVATNSAGAALQMDAGSNGLLLTGSTLFAKPGGAGVYLDKGESGLFVLSTNTISGGGYGIYAATMTPNSQLWITSNTIVSTTTIANNVYGLYLNGLTSGATIENNSVVWRAQGSMGAKGAFSLFSTTSQDLIISNNRFSEPGMITAGSYTGIYLEATSNSAFTFNDVFSTGTNFKNAFLLVAFDNSTQLTVNDNIFFSSFGVAGVGGSTATIEVLGPGTQASWSSDYNDYFSSASQAGAAGVMLTFEQGAAGAPTVYQGLPAWGVTGWDWLSISSNPFYANPGTGFEDFHPYSKEGRWDAGDQIRDIKDAAQSAVINGADPLQVAAILAQGDPNSSAPSQGSYGGTAQASMMFAPAYEGCSFVRKVGAAQTYHTITTALQSLPSVLPPGETCVIIEDIGPYAESVYVGNFTMSGSSLAIYGDLALMPKLTPPAGTAAITISNSSVSVSGITILPASANHISYGILVTSPNVAISNVSIQDPGPPAILAAGIVLSSWTTVSFTSMTLYGANAAGFWLAGSTGTEIFQSSAQINSSSQYALWLDGASSNTIENVYALNLAGGGASLDSGSNFNTVVYATATGGNTGGNGLKLAGAANNIVAYSILNGGGGFNTAGGGDGLFVNSASSNIFGYDLMSGGGGGASGSSGG
ncbi:MAG: beta strand repeat-containing protein, partial [Elusimicrobiota bacterium]